MKILTGPEYGNQFHIEVKNPAAANIGVNMEFTVQRDERAHRIREVSAEVTAGKITDLAKARATYDYVLANMKYDKSGTGWGHDDIYWALRRQALKLHRFSRSFLRTGPRGRHSRKVRNRIFLAYGGDQRRDRRLPLLGGVLLKWLRMGTHRRVGSLEGPAPTGIFL